MCSCFIEFIKRVGERDKMQGVSATNLIISIIQEREC